MIDLDHAARQLGAVWKMVWNAPDWQTGLDRSVDGVFRSFGAILLAAPIAFASYFSLRRASTRIPDFPEEPLLAAPFAVYITAQMIAFLVDWAVTLIALMFAARAVGAARRAGDVVIGFNWGQVFIATAQAIPLVILGVTARGEIAGALLLPSLAFIIAFYWGLIRRSAGAGAAATVAILILLTLLGLIVRSLVGAGALGLYRLLG